jgi:hypothetical protein
LRRDLGVDPIPAVRPFRNYWVNATRNAVKPRWDLAFENWVTKDAKSLPAWRPEPPKRPSIATPITGPIIPPDQIPAELAKIRAEMGLAPLGEGEEDPLQRALGFGDPIPDPASPIRVDFAAKRAAKANGKP